MVFFKAGNEAKSGGASSNRGASFNRGFTVHTFPIRILAARTWAYELVQAYLYSSLYSINTSTCSQSRFVLTWFSCMTIMQA